VLSKAANGLGMVSYFTV